MRTLVATATETAPVDESEIVAVLGDAGHLDVVPWTDWEHATDELLERMCRADALLVRTGTIDEKLIGLCSNLKIITLHGAGVDQVDVAAAVDNGIWVTNVPGANARAVAEMTLGLALAMIRGIVSAHIALSGDDWHGGRFLGRQITSLRWGILGMGHIGRIVGHMASAIGAEIAYFDPYLPPSLKDTLPEEMVELDSKESLLRTSDIISVHVPLSDATFHLVDAESVELMKPEACLINVSRGGVVDGRALAQAAHAGRLGGVALDVFDTEPVVEEELKQLVGPRVIVTPHLAGSTEECLREIARRGTSDILRVWRGETPEYLVAGP
ncbi:MAG: NAD(P)-dependent oxidoreductase [Bacillota bacterium]